MPLVLPRDLAVPMTETIYIPLVDEGVEVRRPTVGERQPDGSFLVRPTPGYDPADEAWAFPPGSRVECEVRQTSAGRVLAAVRLAVPAPRPARQPAVS